MAGPAIPARVTKVPNQLALIDLETGKPILPFQNWLGYIDSVVQALIGLVGNFGGGLAADANAIGHTLSVANFLSGVFVRIGPAGAFSDTTPTAAQIVAAIPNVVVGSNRLIAIQNSAGGLMTLLAGTGVALSGTTTVAAGSTRWFLASVTNATSGSEAINLQGISTASS